MRRWTVPALETLRWAFLTVAGLVIILAGADAGASGSTSTAAVRPEAAVSAWAGTLVLSQDGAEFYRDSAPQGFQGGNCQQWEPRESVTTMSDGDLNLWTSGDTWDSGSEGSCAEVITQRAWQTGVFEVRMYLPGAGGKIADWPAWWFTDFSDWPQGGEIDVLEGLGGEDHTSYHSGPAGATYANGEVQSHGFAEPAVKPGWHTVDLAWSPVWARVYVDGHYEGQLSGSWFRPGAEQLALDITSSAQEDPGGKGASANMLIQYVRVWKFK